jgi:hypothetical protein
MAKKLIELADDSGRKSYTPIAYSENEEVERFKAGGGGLDRLIHETGVKIIFENITDISSIDFYTLSRDEKNKLWSEIANRMRACNSPFMYSCESDGIVRMMGAKSFFGPFNPYECVAKSALEAEEIFNKVIIDCYTKAKDIEGLRDFGKELQKRGFIKQTKEIYKILQGFKSRSSPPINFDEI